MQATPTQEGEGTLRALGHGEMVTRAYLESQMTALRRVNAAAPEMVSQEVLAELVRQMSNTEFMTLVMPISALGHSD